MLHSSFPQITSIRCQWDLFLCGPWAYSWSFRTLSSTQSARVTTEIPHKFPEFLGDNTTLVVNKVWALCKHRFPSSPYLYSPSLYSAWLELYVCWVKGAMVRFASMLWIPPAVSMDVPTEFILLSEIEHSNVGFDLFQDINVTPYPPDQYLNICLKSFTVRVMKAHS